jgi:replication-associated recombination protein RarA
MKQLWKSGKDTMKDRKEPLAYRMSPKNLEEFVGQEHILEKGKMLQNDKGRQNKLHYSVWTSGDW